jgi:hypothetical protein
MGGYVVMYLGGALTWKASRLKIVANSSAEAETAVGPAVLPKPLSLFAPSSTRSKGLLEEQLRCWATIRQRATPWSS